MSLPKISYPINSINVPSMKKVFRFRPFLVKEEKLLLMAKESGVDTDILHAIKQVVNNCSVDERFDVDKLAIFDLEYIFLKLRAMSVDNLVKVSYKDFQDEKVYEFDIDLNTIEMEIPKTLKNKIEITKESGIVLKYPSASLYDDKELLESDKNYLYELIARCIDTIYEGENVFEAKDYSLKDIKDFMDSLDVKTFEKIKEFLVNLPKLKYVIKYKNSLNNEREIELNSLNDFFTFR